MIQLPVQQVKSALVIEDIPEINPWMTEILLNTFAHLEVDHALSIEQADSLIKTKSYDLALVDVTLSDGQGLDIISWLVRFSPDTRCIVVSNFEHDANLIEAICRGATGYLLKDTPPELLKHHLEQYVLGMPAFSAKMMHKILDYIRTHRVPAIAMNSSICPTLPLTSREKEILIYIAQSYSAPAIAIKLGLSNYTVSSYIKEIYRKLNISSRAQAALLAQKYGLLDSLK